MAKPLRCDVRVLRSFPCQRRRVMTMDGRYTQVGLITLVRLIAKHGILIAPFSNE